MALNGKLEELRPPEIFQLIALTRKSGKLLLKRGTRQGVVIFRDGRVVFAASDTLRASLDSALAEGRVATGAVKITEVGRGDPRKITDSGSFVVQVRDDDPTALEQVIRSQIEATVRELVDWRTGTFVFEPFDVPEGAPIELETGWLEAGVDPDSLVLNALTKLDEMERDRWQHDLDRAAAERVEEAAELRRKSEISAAFEVLVDEDTGEISWAPLSSQPAPAPERDLEKLRRITGEMAGLKGISPSVSAELALLILRYAAQILSRGVLFAVGKESVYGIGQFGLEIEGESADRRVARLEIPLDPSSIFTQVVEVKRTFRGRPEPNAWNRYLFGCLGGEEPGDVAVVPLLVDGEPVCLLYGDNLPDRSVLGTVDGIEILMQEIGLAVEKARLQSRLEALERER